MDDCGGALEEMRKGMDAAQEVGIIEIFILFFLVKVELNCKCKLLHGGLGAWARYNTQSDHNNEPLYVYCNCDLQSVSSDSYHRF